MYGDVVHGRGPRRLWIRAARACLRSPSFGVVGHLPTLTFATGTCHEGLVRRLRNFESIASFLGRWEIDEIQEAIDARRGARGSKSSVGPPTSLR